MSLVRLYVLKNFKKRVFIIRATKKCICCLTSMGEFIIPLIFPQHTRWTGFFLYKKIASAFFFAQWFLLFCCTCWYFARYDVIYETSDLLDLGFDYLYEFKDFLLFLPNELPTTYNLFTLFWINFILCTVVSILFYTSLGLNGLFFINGVGLTFFWLSLVINFNSFVVHGHEYTFLLGDFSILSNCHNLTISFFIDKVSYSFAFLTTSISLFVYFFSFCYFRYEPNIERLVTLLLLFVNSIFCDLLLTFLVFRRYSSNFFYPEKYWPFIYFL